MSADLSIPPHSLSIVVPFYNEEENIAPNKRYTLPRPLASADALLLARLGRRHADCRTDPQFQTDCRHAGWH